MLPNSTILAEAFDAEVLEDVVITAKKRHVTATQSGDKMAIFVNGAACTKVPDSAAAELIILIAMADHGRDWVQSAVGLLSQADNITRHEKNTTRNGYFQIDNGKAFQVIGVTLTTATIKWGVAIGGIFTDTHSETVSKPDLFFSAIDRECQTSDW